MTRTLRLAALAVLAFSLAACSTSKRQNPVGSEDEVGKVGEFESDGVPTQYTAKDGDTLRKIAGRPEIYNDPNLWPILQEANADKLGQGTRVNKGMVLDIPRDLSEEQMEEAREKARQAAAASKMGSRPKKRPEAPDEVSMADEKPKAKVESKDATPVPPQPVPKAKKGGYLMPVLLILLLVLAALAGVLFYFMKKDNQEEPKE